MTDTANVAKIAQGTISKVDAERRLVFGWAYVAKRADGAQVVDHSGDVVEDVEDLEDAAYDYVLHSREGDEMHTEKVTARLVESIAFTPDKLVKMGIAADAVPQGWWVGFRVESDETWERVKKGELRMFSVAGSAEREAIDG